MVYLIHFDCAYKHARHYLGFVQRPDMLTARIAKHSSGNGARLMAVITQANITFHVARVWPDGDRTFERTLKNLKATPRLCPTCNPNAMKRTKGVSYAIEPEKVGSAGNSTEGSTFDTKQNGG